MLSFFDFLIFCSSLLWGWGSLPIIMGKNANIIKHLEKKKKKQKRIFPLEFHRSIPKKRALWRFINIQWFVIEDYATTSPIHRLNICSSIFYKKMNIYESEDTISKCTPSPTIYTASCKLLAYHEFTLIIHWKGTQSTANDMYFLFLYEFHVLDLILECCVADHCRLHLNIGILIF